MKVSAIIPSLGHRPEMLKQAVDSIKAQTKPVHEIIVVDYPDETFGNQSRRLNEGVRKSTGEAFFFMGDDDMLKPDFVEKLSNELEKFPEMDIVTAQFQNFGDEDGVHCSGGFPLAATLTRRRIYDKTDGFDEKVPIGVDADFYFQCFEKGAKWMKIPDILYLSRVHKDQYSHTGDWGDYKGILKKKYNGKYSDV